MIRLEGFWLVDLALAVPVDKVLEKLLSSVY